MDGCIVVCADEGVCGVIAGRADEGGMDLMHANIVVCVAFWVFGWRYGRVCDEMHR